MQIICNINEINRNFKCRKDKMTLFFVCFFLFLYSLNIKYCKYMYVGSREQHLVYPGVSITHNVWLDAIPPSHLTSRPFMQNFNILLKSISLSYIYLYIYIYRYSKQSLTPARIIIAILLHNIKL